ncbi:unnamed protein product [Caenorhabditis sp. 36 PRJEB53466]|nr:unnamed protein product [Caenorhabditis sp. 36 PRJEB53466]
MSSARQGTNESGQRRSTRTRQKKVFGDDFIDPTSVPLNRLSSGFTSAMPSRSVTPDFLPAPSSSAVLDRIAQQVQENHLNEIKEEEPEEQTNDEMSASPTGTSTEPVKEEILDPEDIVEGVNHSEFDGSSMPPTTMNSNDRKRRHPKMYVDQGVPHDTVKKRSKQTVKRSKWNGFYYDMPEDKRALSAEEDARRNREAADKVAMIREANVKKILENRSLGKVTTGGQAKAQDAEISQFVASAKNSRIVPMLVGTRPMPKDSIGQYLKIQSGTTARLVTYKDRMIGVLPISAQGQVVGTANANASPSQPPTFRNGFRRVPGLTPVGQQFKEPKHEEPETSDKSFEDATSPRGRSVNLAKVSPDLRKFTVLNNVTMAKAKPGHVPATTRTITLLPTTSMHLNKDGTPPGPSSAINRSPNPPISGTRQYTLVRRVINGQPRQIITVVKGPDGNIIQPRRVVLAKPNQVAQLPPVHRPTSGPYVSRPRPISLPRPQHRPPPQPLLQPPLAAIVKQNALDPVMLIKLDHPYCKPEESEANDKKNSLQRRSIPVNQDPLDSRLVSATVVRKRGGDKTTEMDYMLASTQPSRKLHPNQPQIVNPEEADRDVCLCLPAYTEEVETEPAEEPVVSRQNEREEYDPNKTYDSDVEIEVDMEEMKEYVFRPKEHLQKQLDKSGKRACPVEKIVEADHSNLVARSEGVESSPDPKPAGNFETLDSQKQHVVAEESTEPVVDEQAFEPVNADQPQEPEQPAIPEHRVYLGAEEPMKDLDEDTYRFRRYKIKVVDQFTAKDYRPFGKRPSHLLNTHSARGLSAVLLPETNEAQYKQEVEEDLCVKEKIRKEETDKMNAEFIRQKEALAQKINKNSLRVWTHMQSDEFKKTLKPESELTAFEKIVYGHNALAKIPEYSDSLSHSNPTLYQNLLRISTRGQWKTGKKKDMQSIDETGTIRMCGPVRIDFDSLIPTGTSSSLYESCPTKTGDSTRLTVIWNGVKTKVSEHIPCHLCNDTMRLCMRRSNYRGELREYPAYRCLRKGCQTFRSIKKMIDGGSRRKKDKTREQCKKSTGTLHAQPNNRSVAPSTSSVKRGSSAEGSEQSPSDGDCSPSAGSSVPYFTRSRRTRKSNFSNLSVDFVCPKSVAEVARQDLDEHHNSTEDEDELVEWSEFPDGKEEPQPEVKKEALSPTKDSTSNSYINSTGHNTDEEDIELAVKQEVVSDNEEDVKPNCNFSVDCDDEPPPLMDAVDLKPRLSQSTSPLVPHKSAVACPEDLIKIYKLDTMTTEEMLDLVILRPFLRNAVALQMSRAEKERSKPAEKTSKDVKPEQYVEEKPSHLLPP